MYNNKVKENKNNNNSFENKQTNRLASVAALSSSRLMAHNVSTLKQNTRKWALSIAP